MDVVTLTETGERDFFEGSDGAYYTPVRGVEARCRWCRVWGHQGDLYYRQFLYTRRAKLVCGRHVQREDDWRGPA
ncbi:hypothetical protein [Frigoriglobus tundricola]|uniref:Uncharacterized protein n=1 Tax=Frigoriglobus tundricola TaxID=2774151 RepID=A0A6M5YWS0_9BACT|nr:hypothetical protein [Frigoriglobus tundricola]QJW97904.1 hypothetical protein FTUN_5484 [Frigoriglobus tundricola]